MFIPQKLPLWKNFDDVISFDLWFRLIPINSGYANELEIAWKKFLKTFFLENTCACVLGPWPWPRAFLSLASRGSVLGRAVLGLGLGLGFFLCPWPRPWPRALCPRLHLWWRPIKKIDLYRNWRGFVREIKWTRKKRGLHRNLGLNLVGICGIYSCW